MASKLPWFLSGEPDVLTLLDTQVEASVRGMRAYAAWAGSGSESDAMAVRDAEHAADDARREVMEALRRTLVPPLEPEDLYTMSERIDVVINGAKNVVRDADALDWKPDAAVAGMAALLAEGMEQIAGAVGCIRADPQAASERADGATHCARQVEKAYRAAIVALKDAPHDDALALVKTFDAYRNQLAISDAIVHVAHRIWYSVLRGS